jgi:hypothetical protein
MTIYFRFDIVAFIQLVNARSKIALHLLYVSQLFLVPYYLRETKFCSSVNRVHEAIPYTKALVDEDCSRGDEVWLKHPCVLSPFDVSNCLG